MDKTENLKLMLELKLDAEVIKKLNEATKNLTLVIGAGDMIGKRIVENLSDVADVADVPFVGGMDFGETYEDEAVLVCIGPDARGGKSYTVSLLKNMAEQSGTPLEDILRYLESLKNPAIGPTYIEKEEIFKLAAQHYDKLEDLEPESKLKRNFEPFYKSFDNKGGKKNKRRYY